MNCPICNKELEGNLLERDIFAIHIRNNECNFEALINDVLDLSQLFTNDIMLLLNVCRKLKQVKHLYLLQQNNSIYQKAVESIFPQDLVKITKNQLSKVQKNSVFQQFTSDLAKLSQEEKITQIQIPPKIPIQDSLLKIPFESINQSLLAITVLKREGVLQDKTQLLDLDTLIGTKGMFTNYKQFQKQQLESEYFFKQQSENKFSLKTKQPKFGKSIQSMKSPIQTIEIETTMSECINLSEKSSSKTEKKSDTFVTARQLESMSQFSLDEIEPIISQTPFQKMKDTVIGYYKQLVPQKEVQEKAVFDEIYHLIHQVVRRRFQSIITRKDIREIFITLLPNLETLDGQKITPEILKFAKNHCYQTYLFPHIQMFPQIKRPIEKTMKQQILSTIGLGQQEEIFQLTGTLKQGIMNYKALKFDQSFPTKHQIQQIQTSESTHTLKAINVRENSNPQIICITSLDNQKITNNTKIYHQRDVNIGNYCCLCNLNNQNILCGTESGYITVRHPLQQYELQANEILTTNELFEARATFPKTQMPSFSASTYQRKITVMHGINANYGAVGNLEGYLGIFEHQNFLEAKSIVDCGFTPRSIHSQNQHQVFVTGAGGCILFDCERENLQCLIDIESPKSKLELCYYDILCSQIYNDQLYVSDLAGQLQMLDIRMKPILQLIAPDKQPNVPISQFDIKSNTIAMVHMNGSISCLDIRNPSQIFNKFSQQLQLSEYPSQLKFIGKQKCIVSYPALNQIKIINTQQMKVVNEFVLSYQGDTQLSWLEPITQYDYSFILRKDIPQKGFESEVFTIQTMLK